MSVPGKPLGHFLMVASGVFLSTMDSGMVNIALPYIMRSFSSSLAEVEWVVLVYLSIISISLLLWGKVSDKYGKGIIYLVGMLIFSLGSLCCYFSSALQQLVLSRSVQGVGAAMMMSTGPAIIRLVVPQGEVGRWVGMLGIATSMGLMSGPLIGGYILHNHSWRILFLLNVPVSLTVSILGWLHIVGTAGALPKYTDARHNFDWYGTFMWVALLCVVIILLNQHQTFSVKIWAGGVVLFLVLLYFFIRHETTVSEPLLPVSLLRQNYYGIAMLTAMLSFGVLFFVLILMPFYLSFVLRLSFDKIGYMMMAIPMSLFVVSPLSGRLFDKFGAKYLTFLGMLITAVAIFLLSRITQSSSLVDISWRLCLLGCGQSIFLSPNSASVLSRVTFQDTGITSGMLATCRNLGMLSGVAMVGMIFSAFFSFFSDGKHLREYTVEQLPFFQQAYEYTLFIATVIALGTALLSLLRRA